MAYGLGETSTNLLDLPYESSEPFAPAGLTDMQRQGLATQLQGLAEQRTTANEWSDRVANFNTDKYRSGGNYGGGGGGGGSSYMADNTPGITQGEAWQMGMPGRIDHVNSVGVDPYGQLGNQVNQVGASFNPFNPMLMQMVQQANQQLGRDFNQSVMPGMNRQFGMSGSGAYGGTRAGVAQGIREQGLADAMQRQTTGLVGAGYEAGLGRYVQDRANTLGATGQLQDLIAQNARTAQGHNVNMDLTYNDMLSRDVWNRLTAEQADIANLRSANASRYGSNQAANASMFGASVQANAQRYAAGRSADASLARTDLASQQLAAELANQGAGYSTEMGNRIGNFGIAEQQVNQNTVDWYNRQAADAQNMPWNRMDKYTGYVDPITRPGATGQTNASTGNYTSPTGAAFGGGLAGYGFGQEQWPQGGGTTNPYTGGPQGSYTPHVDPNVTYY